MFTTIWSKILAVLALIGAAITGVAIAFVKGRSDGTKQAEADSTKASLDSIRNEQRVDAEVDEVIHALPVAPVTPESPAVQLDTAPADTAQSRLNILAKGGKP